MNSKKRSTTNWSSVFTMILLVSLVILSGICLLTGFLFLWQDKANSWVPLVIGLLILISSIAGWFFAQQGDGIEEPEPTTVSDNQGNQIVMDTRALESPLAIQNVGTLLNLMSQREPFPEPDEIEDEQESPVPPAVEEARQDEAGAPTPHQI